MHTEIDLTIPKFLRRSKKDVESQSEFEKSLKGLKTSHQIVSEENVNPDQNVQKTFTVKKAPELNVTDRVQLKAMYLYAHIEEIFDNVVWGNTKFDADSLYSYFYANGVSAKVATQVKNQCEEHIEQFFNYPDDYEKSLVKVGKKFWKEAIDTCDKFIDNEKKSKVRKPRKRRVSTRKSTEKKIAKFKYLAHYNEFKLGSVNPQNVIGAKTVWLFNTKNKMLTQLNAAPNASIDIKGQTFINVDEVTSVSKRIGRKTEEVLKTIGKATKPQCRKAQKDVNAQEAKLQLRSNDHTVIVRVF